jgi:hypothetical protein
MCSLLAQKQLTRISSWYPVHATDLTQSLFWNLGLPTHYVISVVLVDILLFLIVRMLATGNAATDLEYWSGSGVRNVTCIKYNWQQCLSDGILWNSGVTRSEGRVLQEVIFLNLKIIIKILLLWNSLKIISFCIWQWFIPSYISELLHD